MRRLQEYHSSELVWEALGFVQTRLNSREQLRPLAAEVGAVRDQVEVARSDSRKALERVRASTAEIGWRDGEVDAAVMSISRAVLSDVRGDRKAPLYQRLFPIAPSKGVKGKASDAQHLFVQGVLETLATPPFERYAERAQALRLAQDALVETLTAQEQLFVQHGQAVGREEQVVSEARRFYNNLYGRLLVIVESKDLVESFFFRGGALRGGSGDGSDAPDGTEE